MIRVCKIHVLHVKYMYYMNARIYVAHDKYKLDGRGNIPTVNAHSSYATSELSMCMVRAALASFCFDF